MWLPGVQVVAGHFHQTAFVKKAGIDGTWLMAGGVQPVFDVEQKNLAELRYRLGGPVVAPH
ncbi:hypothetical protein D3C71_1750530 [compost metagenome]